MDTESLSIAGFQKHVSGKYEAADRARGPAKTFLWFMEEVGELAAALRDPSANPGNLALECADVLAWLATLANIAGVDLDDAVQRKYGAGCPNCGSAPCVCGAAKP